MSQKRSAGILCYRKNKSVTEVFLVHPGGPFWRNKDEGAWSVPKGEYEPDEDALRAAIREFKEETSLHPEGDFRSLVPVRQKSGKIVECWAVQFDFDAAIISSNNFEIEWPPRSGKIQQFPEVDRGEWLDLARAKKKINPAQISFLDQLESILIP